MGQATGHRAVRCDAETGQAGDSPVEAVSHLTMSDLWNLGRTFDRAYLVEEVTALMENRINVVHKKLKR